jgi:hypothetical protein
MAFKVAHIGFSSCSLGKPSGTSLTVFPIADEVDVMCDQAANTAK